MTVPPVPRCVEVPASSHYVLANARVPAGCVEGGLPAGTHVCVDHLAELDIEVRDGRVAALHPAGEAAAHTRARALDLRGKMVLPTFADLHTHIGALLGRADERGRQGGWLLEAGRPKAASSAQRWRGLRACLQRGRRLRPAP
jgi:cytosine/adenosine deaminase-related metal-dependent hydrolase